MANRDKILIQSLEPLQSDEVTMLLRHFSAENVKLFYILRHVIQFKRMKECGPVEEYIANVLLNLSSTPSLGSFPHSLTELEQSYANYFQEPYDWREVPETWFDPTEFDQFTNEIARKSSTYRNHHMVKLITKAVLQKKRVFAVVGFSHVIMQENALRTLLR
ncbi:MAG: hypothetical protein CV087_23515 [Candidatus Brocadia sp. WS118]|nr:MAG: hypothetical protein CV087_23515 [Candidatus Brocadia sp. WS118]